MESAGAFFAGRERIGGANARTSLILAVSLARVFTNDGSAIRVNPNERYGNAQVSVLLNSGKGNT